MKIAEKNLCKKDICKGQANENTGIIATVETWIRCIGCLWCLLAIKYKQTITFGPQSNEKQTKGLLYAQTMLEIKIICKKSSRKCAKIIQKSSGKCANLVKKRR